MVRFGLTRAVLHRILGPQGVYEWVIARTRYFDEALRTACGEGFSQVLVFGAGFDSRGVRRSRKREVPVAWMESCTRSSSSRPPR